MSARLTFRSVRLFDGDAFHDDVDVTAEAGFIVEVGSSRGDGDVVDGEGCTLMPGLIDAHTHAFGDALRQALVFGVTTELDMFTSWQFAAAMRAEQEAGAAIDRADMYSAGTCITCPGGHGTEYGLPIPTITGPDEAEGFVDGRLGEGSDYIKIIYSPGMPAPSIDRATLDAVVAAARRRGALVVVHVHTLDGARDVVAAGAHGLAHMFSDRAPDQEFMALAERSGIFVVPTLTVIESVCGTASGETLCDDQRLTPFLGPRDVTALRDSFPGRQGFSLAVAQTACLQFEQSGLPVLAGTDAPNPGTAHGVSVHRELELLVDAGLSPLEALRAATSAPADIFALNDRGRIRPGVRADLVLVDGDPRADITDTRAIVGVWKAGKQFDRDAYRAQIKDLYT